VLSDRHVGERPPQHAQLRGDLVGDAEQHSLDRRGHVLPHEQLREVGVVALGVQVHQLRALDGQAALPQDVDLDGDVGNVLRLHAVRGLDLDHAVAAGPLPLEDVHGGVGVVGEERGLVEGGSGGIAPQRLARGRHLVVELVERQVDELAARHVLPRPVAHLGALREQVLQGLGGDQLGGLGLVHPPPQLLVTLQPRQEAGLRELGGCARVGGHRRETNGLGDVWASATSARAKYISCA